MAHPAAGTATQDASRFCREILPGVSRTFALSIRVLPGALGDSVRCAYLICRIADTVEDEPAMPAARKAELLDLLDACLETPAGAAPFAAAVRDVSGEPAHVRLTRNADLVFTVYWSLPAAARAHMRRWIGEMIAGMRKFVLLYPHGIRIQSIEEYREYCYYVAGTVGYLLTDLWRDHTPTISPERYEALRARSRAFGEALQTVNILKDVAVDARQENAVYIPEQLLREHGASHATMLSDDRAGQSRAALTTLLQLASADLEHAKQYLLLLPRRAPAIRLFCVLPLLFAYATLRDLTRAGGVPGARTPVKISRREVKLLTFLGIVSVLSNRALGWLAARVRARPLLSAPPPRLTTSG